MKKRRVLYVVIAVAIAAVALVIWRMDIPNWVELDVAKLTELEETCLIYDNAGNELSSLSGALNRRPVELSQISKAAIDAVISAEDARFFTHSGVDVLRIGGALISDIKTMSLDQGASTITQQLIKLTHLTGEKTLKRKSQEAYLAIKLESIWSKEQILTAYLNCVYFGGAGTGVGAYGIEAAALTFFSKSASELNIAEGALLAAIIKSPSGYSPVYEPEHALARRNMILDKMAEHGYIDSADAYKAMPLGLNVRGAEEEFYGWYVDAVMSEATQVLGISSDELITSGYSVYTALNADIQDSADALFRDGANFPDAAADGTPAQAALAVVDVRNGEVAALVGGREYSARRGLNRATSIARQPGSAIKPISTYAAAIDARGYLPSSVIPDEERTYANGYTPGNAGGKYYGNVTVREAVSRSLNAATVALADKIGINLARSYASRMGLSLTGDDSNLSLALGAMTYGVSPLDLAAAYAPIANGGTRNAPYIIRRIINRRGETVYERAPQGERVLNETSAYLLYDVLKTAATQGSAKALSAAGYPIAGKTGTVEMEGGGNRDAWTVGLSGKYAVAVWMGFDEPDARHALAQGVTGSSYPARLVAKLMRACAEYMEGGEAPLPDGLTRAAIDAYAINKTGKAYLASVYTPSEYVINELFSTSALPAETSPYWLAPGEISDLRSTISENGRPVLQFTAENELIEYVIFRYSGETRDIIGVISGDAGETLEFADASAPGATSLKYGVMPRHKALYELGKLITGPEAVIETRAGLISGIAWLFGS